MAVDFIKL